MTTRLRVVSVALAAGLTWGFGVLLLGWVSGGGWGGRLVDVLSSVYVGYAPTFLGGLIGGAWAFVDGFVAGLVLAFFYNAFAGPRSEPVSILKQTEQPAH